MFNFNFTGGYVKHPGRSGSTSLWAYNAELAMQHSQYR